MAERIEGLRVLVTAAGGGLGREIALWFLKRGAKVFACDIEEGGLASLRAQAASVQTMSVDAGDANAVKECCARSIEWLGGIDVLVNNVGIGGPTAPAEDVSLADWNTCLAVNLTSHFLFIQGAIPAMKAQANGLVVNISSGCVKFGLPLRLPYVASKGAVESMTYNLARELGPSGIRVNAIRPGPLRGERVERIIDEKSKALGITRDDYAASLVRYTSLRTLTEHSDVAEMIGFLASPGGVRITGQIIGVDGNHEWEE